MSNGELALIEGLYESVITAGLQGRLDRLSGMEATTKPIEEADLPHVLAHHVAVAVEQVLRSTRSTEERLRLVNGLLDSLDSSTDEVGAPPSRLLRLASQWSPAEWCTTDLSERVPPT